MLVSHTLDELIIYGSSWSCISTSSDQIFERNFWKQSLWSSSLLFYHYDKPSDRRAQDFSTANAGSIFQLSSENSNSIKFITRKGCLPWQASIIVTTIIWCHIWNKKVFVLIILRFPEMALALYFKGQIFCNCRTERRTSIQSSAPQKRPDTFYIPLTALLCPLVKGKPLMMTSGLVNFSFRVKVYLHLFNWQMLHKHHKNCW